jgi:hypothetical protein
MGPDVYEEKSEKARRRKKQIDLLNSTERNQRNARQSNQRRRKTRISENWKMDYMGIRHYTILVPSIRYLVSVVF